VQSLDFIGLLLLIIIIIIKYKEQTQEIMDRESGSRNSPSIILFSTFSMISATPSQPLPLFAKT